MIFRLKYDITLIIVIYDFLYGDKIMHKKNIESSNENNIIKSKTETFELISNFLFSFFFTFFAIIAVGQVGLKLFGFNMLNVETGSMEPVLPVNTLVFVQSAEPETIKEGDVITFVINEKGTLATHRVININSGKRIFVTKGDANNTDDGSISWDNVVGVMRFKIPKIGGVFQIITAPENRPLIITVIVILLVGIFIWETAVKIIKNTD